MTTKDRSNLAAFPLEHTLTERGIRFRVDHAGQLVLHCPRCGREKLYVDRVSKYFHCFYCQEDGMHGGVVMLIRELLHLEWRDAFQFVEAAVGTAPPLQPRPARAVPVRLNMPRGTYPLSDPSDPEQAPYWRYLRGRRVSEDIVRRYQLHFGWYGQLGGRVVVPVLVDDQMVSYVARAVPGIASEPKALTPGGAAQGQMLFNLGRARAVRPVVVVEGVFDALRLPDRCVASFGKKLSSAQASALVKAQVQRVVIAFDGDAWEETVRIAVRYSGWFQQIQAARLPAGMDPSDLTAQEMVDCIEAAKPVDGFDLVEAMVERDNARAWKKWGG